MKKGGQKRKKKKIYDNRKKVLLQQITLSALNGFLFAKVFAFNCHLLKNNKRKYNK